MLDWGEGEKEKCEREGERGMSGRWSDPLPSNKQQIKVPNKLVTGAKSHSCAGTVTQADITIPLCPRKCNNTLAGGEDDGYDKLVTRIKDGGWATLYFFIAGHFCVGLMNG